MECGGFVSFAEKHISGCQTVGYRCNRVFDKIIEFHMNSQLLSSQEQLKCHASLLFELYYFVIQRFRCTFLVHTGESLEMLSLDRLEEVLAILQPFCDECISCSCANLFCPKNVICYAISCSLAR